MVAEIERHLFSKSLHPPLYKIFWSLLSFTKTKTKFKVLLSLKLSLPQDFWQASRLKDFKIHLFCSGICGALLERPF